MHARPCLLVEAAMLAFRSLRDQLLQLCAAVALGVTVKAEPLIAQTAGIRRCNVRDQTKHH